MVSLRIAVRIELSKRDALQSRLAVYGGDFRAFVHRDVRRRTDPADEILGHSRSQALSNQQVNGSIRTTFGEKHRRLSRGITAPDDCDVLPVVENGFDGRTRVMDSRRFKALRAF